MNSIPKGKHSIIYLQSWGRQRSLTTEKALPKKEKNMIC